MLYKEKENYTIPGVLSHERASNALERRYERRAAIDKEYLYEEQVGEELQEVRGEFVKTKQGTAYARVGDYILTDTVSGDQWVCKTANFDTRFEEVAE